VQRLGLVLVLLGTAVLVGAAVFTCIHGRTETSGAGSIAAVGMFIVIVGMVFFFPTLLAGDGGATSTMRVAVLLVVSLFVVLTINVGWGAPSLEKLKLDPNWTWVLAAALGGKAFQSFAEHASPGTDGKPKPTDGATGPAGGGGAPSSADSAAPVARPSARRRDADDGIEDTP